MSTNHTEHYALSLWEASDQVTRTEFNENHAKIDAALAGLQAGQLRIHTGFYRGTGTETRTIEFPFRPIYLRIRRGLGFGEEFIMMGENCSLAATVNDWVSGCMNGNHFNATWNENTLTIEGVGSDLKGGFAMNVNGYPYMYIAIG